MATILDSILEIGAGGGLCGDQGCILALDAGTTSVRAILFDEFGHKVASAQRPLTMRYPRPGWVEQDPVEILSAQIACMIEVQYKSGIHSDRIRSVGITNQRETVVVWERASGQPIYNAVVWQCRRTAPEIERIVGEGHGPHIREVTGLVPDAYFSASKISWILDNVEGARELADTGGLLCGTVDSWLVYNLTGGLVHATDFTNASRTMLFDIRRLTWDDGLLELFNIPRAMLPDPRPSAGDFGRVSPDIMTFTPPITGVAGDQQASLFGHGCFEAGSVKNTYGTGCFMLMNTGPELIESSHGLLSTIGVAEGGRVDYALEGSVFQAGSVVQWLRDELGIIESAEETCALAQSVPDTGGCYIVPAFTGLGAPWWSPDARGLVCGITRGTSRAKLVRAALESMAFQTYDVLKAMEGDSGHTLAQLAVDGGGANNDFVVQFQADLLGIDVVRAPTAESTALGVAYLAGLGSGFWADRDEIASLAEEGRHTAPQMDAPTRERLLGEWHEAVGRALG